jgi:hypothetical protein
MTVEAKTTKQDFLDEAVKNGRKIVFTYHEVDSAKEHKYIDDMETAHQTGYHETYSTKQFARFHSRVGYHSIRH